MTGKDIITIAEEISKTERRSLQMLSELLPAHPDPVHHRCSRSP